MRLTIIFTIFIFLLTACSKEQVESVMVFGKVQRAPTVQHPQEVVVVTYSGSDTYYLNADNQYTGLEHDLAQLFSSKYAPEYKVKFLVVDHISEVLPALAQGKADIAAAALPVSTLKAQQFSTAPAYYETQPLLVYNKSLNEKPAKLHLPSEKKLAVSKDAGLKDDLNILSVKNPELTWFEDQNNNPETLLSEVANGHLDYTVANSHLVNLMQNFYPDLQEAFPIGKPEKIAWALGNNIDARLQKKIDQFFVSIKKDGQLRNLLDRHYGHTERLAENDITHFLTLAETELPKYKHLFKKAAAETGLNWRLLAALSYRESHWDANNTSPTNVRGLMMLTENTAEAMGVTDRLDPTQSIPAGAKYILELKSLFPKTIPDQDRTYFALAAYNIGFSHVQDARTLAKRLKLNPDSWSDIKRTLVLLSDPTYYNTVKNGYASGGAPVILVETVRSYQNILEKYQPSKMQMLSRYFTAAK